MLLQLSFFSSSLQPHLTAFNIVPFCSTGSCRLCFTKITLPIISLYMTVTLIKSQSRIAKQVRLHRQGEAGSQQIHNTWCHKGCFTSISQALWIHCSPVLMYQWCSPLTTSSKDFTSTNWSQPLPLASGFWFYTSQMGQFAEVAIKWTISYHKPILQMNIVLSGIISCWKHPHFLRLKGYLPNFTEAFCPELSLFHSNFSCFVSFLFCLSPCRSGFAVK